MRAPSSRSPTSNSGCWGAWAMSWQPSRLWLGLTSSMQQRLQSNSLAQPQPAVPAAFLADFANQVAAAHVHIFPFSVSSRQPVRLARLLGLCLCSFGARRVRGALNSLPAVSLRPSPVRSRPFCGRPRHKVFEANKMIRRRRSRKENEEEASGSRHSDEMVHADFC